MDNSDFLPLVFQMHGISTWILLDSIVNTWIYHSYNSDIIHVSYLLDVAWPFFVMITFMSLYISSGPFYLLRWVYVTICTIIWIVILYIICTEFRVVYTRVWFEVIHKKLMRYFCAMYVYLNVLIMICIYNNLNYGGRPSKMKHKQL